MATYANEKTGETIITNFIYVSYYNAEGELTRRTQIDKWTQDAEKWIDNDIESGYYAGFKKITQLLTEGK
jgi:hypothetical protein